MFLRSYSVKAINRTNWKTCILKVHWYSSKSIEKELDNYYQITDIKPIKSKFEIQLEMLFKEPISKTDILRLLNFLAQALERRVKLKKALEFLHASEEKSSVKILLEDLISTLEKSFTSYFDIFSRFPKYFDDNFLWIVKAWETSGNLPENIFQYIHEEKKIIEQKKTIQAVFMRRWTLLLAVIWIATVILTFVIPKFLALFSKANTIPPVLIFFSWISSFLTHYWILTLITLIWFWLITYVLIKNFYTVRKQFDLFLLKIPILNDIIRTYYTCHYLYFTWTLLKKNVWFVKIMNIIIEQCQNIPFKEVFEIMNNNIKAWQSLQDMLKYNMRLKSATYKPIPKWFLLPSLTQALEMWAATWNLWQILYDSFLAYEQILNEKIDKWIKIFDKIFYAFIVTVIGWLIFAMWSAMASLYKNAWQLMS